MWERPMKINYNYSNLLVRAEFKNKLNIIFDDSATGKSYFFRILESYCKENNISCRRYDYINYSNLQTDINAESEVLILDNADLYLTTELLDKLVSKHKLILICAHSLAQLPTSELDYFTVNFTANALEVVADEF